MLQKLSKDSLTKQVLGQIRNYVLTKGLDVGDRLPSELEFSQELGVSRNTVREALKTMETVGALSRKPKTGTVLREADLGLLAEFSKFLFMRSAGDLRELWEARKIVELGILPLIIESATDEQYQEMEDACKLMEAEEAAGDLGVEGDLQFHQAMLAASNNKFMMQFGSLIHEFFRSLPARLRSCPDVTYDVDLHRQMISYLRNGDLQAATDLTLELLNSYVRFGIV